MKNANLFCVFIFSSLVFLLKAEEMYKPFIPKKDTDFSYSQLPPFTSELLKAAHEKREEREMGEIEQIVKNVVKGNDKELEKQAEELVEDKEKLQRFLSAFSPQLLGTEKETPSVDLSKEAKKILDSSYKDSQLQEKNVSVKLKNTNVREAIELIGKSVGLDFVVDPVVSGMVSNIYLKNVSAGSALNIILSSNNPRLALIKDLGIWRILKLQDAVQVLKNKTEKLKQKGFLSDFATIQYAKWTESFKHRVEKMWLGVVGSQTEKEGYYIVFEDDSRKIFFRAKKREVADFKRFLKEIDSRVPQIRIEARIVLASKDFEESFGFQIGGIYNRSASVSHGWNYIGQGDVKSPQHAADMTDLNSWALNLLPATATKFLNLPFILGGRNLDTKRLNIVLNASENRNEIKTILKPTLLVNSEEPAEILVGEEVPIETRVQERIEGTLRDLDTVSYKDLGMKLRVKPVVAPDKKTVFLDIYVEHSYVKAGATSTTFDAKKSIIVTTRSSSKVALNSGQTTLIGGLITQGKRIEKHGIPILQEIPILGALFSGSKRAKTDEQLMIFISPTII